MTEIIVALLFVCAAALVAQAVYGLDKTLQNDDEIEAERFKLWTILEEIDAQIDLEEQLDEDFQRRVTQALWGSDED